MYDFSKKKNKKSTCSSCDHSGWNDAAYDCTCGTVVINLFM